MEQVIITADDGIVSIKLNRSEKKNALTGAMYNCITTALENAASDPKVRVVAITAAGDSFTAGNDIDDFLNGPQPQGYESPALLFLHVLTSFPRPVIVGVNGLAVGIGVTLLLHCDVVLASNNATFRLPFVDLGLVPQAASSLSFASSCEPGSPRRPFVLLSASSFGS